MFRRAIQLGVIGAAVCLALASADTPQRDSLPGTCIEDQGSRPSDPCAEYCAENQQVHDYRQCETTSCPCEEESCSEGWACCTCNFCDQDAYDPEDGNCHPNL